MSTPETSLTDSPHQARSRQRPMWPWVVGASLLCLFAAGLSLYWPIYQAKRLIEFAEAAGGRVSMTYHHPDWMSGFVPEELCIPRYDQMTLYFAPEAPIPDRLLRQLTRFPQIEWLTLDISACHPESLEVLGQLQKLHHVTLIGNGEPIPLDWIQHDPDLLHIELNDIPVRPPQWGSALSTPQITGLQTFADERAILYRYEIIGQTAVQNYVGAFLEQLTKAEALAMRDLPNLTWVVLEYDRADDEFWETLSQCRNLEKLSIYERNSTVPLSEQTLEQLEQIKPLKSLTLIDHPDLSQAQNVTPAWKTFKQSRPDVDLVQVSTRTPE